MQENSKKNSLRTFPCKPFRECRDSFHLPLQIQKNCRNFLKIAERGVKLRKNMEDWRNWVNCENQKINTKKGSACFPPTKSRKGISKCQVPCIFSYFVLSLLFWPKNAYFEYFPLIKLFWSFCRIFPLHISPFFEVHPLPWILKQIHVDWSFFSEAKTPKTSKKCHLGPRLTPFLGGMCVIPKYNEQGKPQAKRLWQALDYPAPGGKVPNEIHMSEGHQEPQSNAMQ